MNYSKYKRVIAFGCSFTNHYYPTWADIIAKCCENAEFINLGHGGAGNQFIASRLTQAKAKLHLCDTDLILVMFSTPYREDRWINGEWKLYGNLYNQSHYDKKFVNEYTDPVGLLLRDLATVETAYTFINSLPCDNIILRASDQSIIEFLKPHDPHYDRVSELYTSSILNQLPIALLPMFYNSVPRMLTSRVIKSRVTGKKFSDGHPTATDYLNYLQHITIPLTDAAIQYALDSNRVLLNIEYREDFPEHFPDISNIHERHGIF
jgi:hypothetical protein